MVDHGLRSALGHNLTYARRVLDAAAAHGLRTVAATGSEDPALAPCAESLGLFSHDVWANNPTEGRRWIVAAIARRAASGPAPREPAGAGGDVHAALPVAAPLWRRLAAAARQDLDALGRAWAAPARFARELGTVPQRAALCAGDVVYLPTVLATELRAVDRLLRRSASARGLRWRLLLRYPPSGPAARRAMRRSLRRLSRAGADVRLFCDTEPLCRLYEELSGLAFELAPVPVGRGFTAPRAPDEGFTVGYFGDARDEKGFHLLPGVIAAVRAQADLAHPVRFVLQVNLNTDEGDERTRAALDALAMDAAPDVELQPGPLSQDAYRAIFHRADLVLAPYDPAAYRERSSGVFMEAVARGVPMVVTQGSWMAHALAPSNPPPAVLARWTAESIARSILTIRDHRAEYDAWARSLSAEVHARHDPDILVRLLCERQPSRGR